MEMKRFGLNDGLIRPDCDRNLENLRLHVDRGNALHGICNESVNHRLFVLMKSTARQTDINKYDAPSDSLSSELTSFEPEINKEGCQ